jgi:CelD/BcsL family acetyltransferase involved in cellulose biosynthesis
MILLVTNFIFGVIATTMDDYRISVIDSFAQWKELRTEWNILLEKSAMPSVFLTWEWLYSWAECFLDQKRRLFIICVHDRGEIVGIAPLYLERVRFVGMILKRLSFLGTPESGSDYLDVIMKKGKEREITSSIYKYITTEASSKWDYLMLADLQSTSLFLLYFMSQIGIEGKYVEITRASYCPVAVLPGSIDLFLSGLSRKKREQFRRHSGILQPIGQLRHESRYGNENELIDIFFNLYELRWGGNSEKLQNFVKSYISKKPNNAELQIDLLKCDEVYVAGLLHFRYKQTLLMYLMAVDKKFNPKISTGNILVGLCMQNAINQGISTYDFLKGEESYKFHWATHGNVSNNIFFYQKKLIPLLFALSRQLKDCAKLILR